MAGDMSGVIELRDARSDDALGIASVQVETWQQSYVGIIPDATLTGLSVPDQALDWARSLSITGNGARTFVTCRDGEILGFVSAGPNRSRELPFRGEVYALYVATDWQNRGLGRALLGRGFVALMEAGLGSALIWVLARNPARFFYEAHGGKPVASRDEVFEGSSLAETGYGWPDLEAWRIGQDVQSDRR